jgi:hypothetical protein
MTPAQSLMLACFTIAVGWSAYEAYRMRRHRLKTDLLMSVTTCTLINLDKRLTLAVQNDAAIAEAITALKSRPTTPPAE